MAQNKNPHLHKETEIEQQVLEYDGPDFIRGVNIGGWLLAERFITPYLFAVNSCHMRGDLCWYPGQIGAPSTTTPHDNKSNQTNNNNILCNMDNCDPMLTVYRQDGCADYHPRNAQWYYDYPKDEYTLGEAFAKYSNKDIARKYMERHWDTFVTYSDLKSLKQAGVTHLRVPMGYWIRGDIRPDEPWIDGGWPYFVRFAKWCRKLGLQVWVDLHGAPGSENGFDNSGRYNQQKSTCEGWSTSSENVARTSAIIQEISMGLLEDDLLDVVTGFGLLNEPFLDCDPQVLRQYYDHSFSIVRSLLGPNIHVFIGDKFSAWTFNDGYWQDEKKYNGTYLDSHPYHVFFEQGRALSPKQHIAYTCNFNAEQVKGCCYQDYATDNVIPSKGIGRIIGEWSAAYDRLPTALETDIMKHIAKHGYAPELSRNLTKDRQAFMRNFVEAQMVTYESITSGVSSGWLFWNFKMEGGAYAEWDFLRGIKEGWMPEIPPPNIASETMYGSCYSIMNRTLDNYSAVVNEYPDPRTLDWNQWQGWTVDDDFVLNAGDGIEPPQRAYHYNYYHGPGAMFRKVFPFVGSFLCVMLIGKVFWKQVMNKADKRASYMQLK